MACKKALEVKKKEEIKESSIVRSDQRRITENKRATATNFSNFFCSRTDRCATFGAHESAREDKTLMQEIRRPDEFDGKQFEKIPPDFVRDFLTYSINSSRLLLEAITKADTKCIAQIPVMLTMYGGYYLWIKPIVTSNHLMRNLFYVNTSVVAIAVTLCVICLWVRTIPFPPSVPMVIDWLRDKDVETVKKSLFPQLFFNLADAEYRCRFIVNRKGILLKLSQLVFLIFLLISLISAVISIHVK